MHLLWFYMLSQAPGYWKPDEMDLLPYQKPLIRSGVLTQQGQYRFFPALQSMYSLQFIAYPSYWID